MELYNVQGHSGFENDDKEVVTPELESHHYLNFSILTQDTQFYLVRDYLSVEDAISTFHQKGAQGWNLLNFA